MPDSDDIRWLRESANDLNNLLQIIVESSAALNPMSEQHPEAAKYIGFIRQSLERAKNVTALMASRLGGLTNVDASATLQPPVSPPAPNEPKVANPEGARELILLIDDEEMIGVLAGEMLTQA